MFGKRDERGGLGFVSYGVELQRSQRTGVCVGGGKERRKKFGKGGKEGGEKGAETGVKRGDWGHSPLTTEAAIGGPFCRVPHFRPKTAPKSGHLRKCATTIPNFN